MNSIAARLELVGTEALPGRQLDYAVVNTGAVAIVLGPAYQLERFTGHGWECVRGPDALRAWGHRLEAASRYELTANVPSDAQPGRHRLRIRLPADPSYAARARDIDPIELTAEFELTQVSGVDGSA